MTLLDFGLLVVAGFFAGLIGFVTGLASLVSYPALLAVGLPAVSANVTNTVALVAAGVGATASSSAELARTASSWFATPFIRRSAVPPARSCCSPLRTVRSR